MRGSIPENISGQICQKINGEILKKVDQSSLTQLLEAFSKESVEEVL